MSSPTRKDKLPCPYGCAEALLTRGIAFSNHVKRVHSTKNYAAAVRSAESLRAERLTAKNGAAPPPAKPVAERSHLDLAIQENDARISEAERTLEWLHQIQNGLLTARYAREGQNGQKS